MNSTSLVSEELQMAVIVTNHAAERIKKRLGLPKKTCQTHAQAVYENGFKLADAKGRAKRYLYKLFCYSKKANQLRVYGEFVYIFTGSTLITVLNLPKGMRTGFKKKAGNA